MIEALSNDEMLISFIAKTMLKEEASTIVKNTNLIKIEP